MDEQSGGNSPFGEWGSLLQGVLLGAAEGVARTDGRTNPTVTAGSRGGSAGTAGAIEFQDGNSRDYANDKKQGFDTQTLVIGAVVLIVGLVVLKKVL